MNEEAKTTTQSPSPATTSTPSVSADDIQKLVDAKVQTTMSSLTSEFEKKISTAKSTAFDDVSKKIVSALSPEQEKETDPIHLAFAQHPKEFVTTLVKEAKEQAKKEFQDAQLSQNEIDRAIKNVYGQYPDLQKVPNEIYFEAEKLDANLPVSERLSKAAKVVAERLNFKSQEDAERQSIMQETAMMPTGGSVSYSYNSPSLKTSAQQLANSARDYMTGRREKFGAVSGNRKEVKG